MMKWKSKKAHVDVKVVEVDDRVNMVEVVLEV